jgi:hypothetical protein
MPDRPIGGGETIRDIQWVDLFLNWDTGIRKILGVIQPETGVQAEPQNRAIHDPAATNARLAISTQDFSNASTTLSNGIDDTILYLSPSLIYEKIIDLLELGREISVRRYITRGAKLFIEELEGSKSSNVNEILEIRDNKLTPILDFLQAIGVACIACKNWESLEDVQAGLYRICYRAEKVRFPKFSQDTFWFDKIWVWQQVIFRVYSLGAVLVYRGHWKEAQKLIEQEIDWDDFHRLSYWSRYILTMVARVDRIEKKRWMPSIISNLESHQWLSEFFMSDKDLIISAVCQFDFLQCIYTNSSRIDKWPTRPAYPSFGIYYKSRTEPIIAKLISTGALRDTISQVSDVQLATMISELDIMAGSEFFAYDGWVSGGWSNKMIPQFLAKNLDVEERG